MRASSFAPGAVIKIEDQRLILINDCLIDDERHWFATRAVFLDTEPRLSSSISTMSQRR